MKIQVEEDPTVESPLVKEECEPLIERIIVKNQVILQSRAVYQSRDIQR